MSIIKMYYLKFVPFEHYPEIATIMFGCSLNVLREDIEMQLMKIIIPHFRTKIITHRNMHWI